MADTKITGLLTPQVTTNPATDVLPIVNIADTLMAASGSTRKITVNQLLGAGGTATLASATITGDLTVDTSTLKVDSANNRVIVGHTSGSSAFQVSNAGGAGFEVQPTGVASSPALLSYNRSGAAWTQLTYLALQHVWQNSGTDAMTLNATGLGVGVSPSYNIHARGTTNGRIQVEGASGFGMVFIQASSGNAAQLQLNSSGGSGRRFNVYSDSTGLFGISDETAVATRLAIDSSGNVGIGVTPSAWAAGFKAAQVGSRLVLTTTGSDTFFGNNFYNDGSYKFINADYATYYDQTTGKHVWGTSTTSGAVNGVITWNPAMTLDASGNLLVGKTASSSTVIGAELRPSGAIISTLAASTNSDFALYTYSTGAGAARFYVGMSGTVFATNTTISAISDQRLKENVQDIDVGLGAILALKPRKFDWKAGKGKDIKGDRGFIAQEFEQVFPQLVDEWADPSPEGEAPYKSVRQDLIPVLVKAIQELAARVQTLETR